MTLLLETTGLSLIHGDQVGENKDISESKWNNKVLCLSQVVLPEKLKNDQINIFFTF